MALLGLIVFVRLEAAETPSTALSGEAAEVIGILKSRYVDREKLNEKLLNEATVKGILQVLGEGAVIVTPEQPGTNATQTAGELTTTGDPLARAEVIDPNVGYIRIADVGEQTPSALDAELKKFADVKAEGYILDLRFADGTNYAAAAELAGRFLDDGQALFALKRGDGELQQFRSSAAHDGPNLGDAPLMILVNAQTRGAAETLAGALRAQERGILVGSKTAGTAVAWDDISLRDGRVLRVATAKVLLPSKPGSDAMSVEVFPQGVTPDVPVKIDATIERDVLLNGKTNVTLTASLEPRQVKKGLTEAELVKAFRGDSIDSQKPATGSAEEGEIQQVRDVVLQRAMDILKGIRVLLSWK